MAVITNIKGPKGDAGTNGTPGADGDAGANGSNGAAGSKWFSGAGAPSDSLGVNGDFYLNTTSGDVSVKAASTWA